MGQHFLVDKWVLGRIMRAAEISDGDVVVEIGPGRGILTGALAGRAGRVVAVEVDEALASALSIRFESHPTVQVIAADARHVDIDSLVGPGVPYKLVANLPYYAASPIIRRFLEADSKPSVMVVMVQREVAQSMAASPGKMGILSVAIQVYGRPRVVCNVPPRAFRPSPKVTSSVVRIDVYEAPAVAFDSPEGFFRLVRAGFSAPRKQIHNSLRAGLGISSEDALALLSEAGIEPSRRAQSLSVSEWGELYGAFRQDGQPSG